LTESNVCPETYENWYIYIGVFVLLRLMDVTTIGPVEKSTRDRLKNLRDAKGHANYNEALRYLLNKEDFEN
jgi:hypothetical protein